MRHQLPWKRGRPDRARDRTSANTPQSESDTTAEDRAHADTGAELDALGTVALHYLRLRPVDGQPAGVELIRCQEDAVAPLLRALSTQVRALHSRYVRSLVNDANRSQLGEVGQRYLVAEPMFAGLVRNAGLITNSIGPRAGVCLAQHLRDDDLLTALLSAMLIDQRQAEPTEAEIDGIIAACSSALLSDSSRALILAVSSLRRSPVDRAQQAFRALIRSLNLPDGDLDRQLNEMAYVELSYLGGTSQSTAKAAAHE